MPNIRTYPPGTVVSHKKVNLTLDNFGGYYLAYPYVDFLISGVSADANGNNDRLSYGWCGVDVRNNHPNGDFAWSEMTQRKKVGWMRIFYPSRRALWNPTDGLHDNTKSAINVLDRLLNTLDFHMTSGANGGMLKCLFVLNAFDYYSTMTPFGNDITGQDGENEWTAYLDALFGSTQTSPLGYTLALHPAFCGIEIVNENTRLTCFDNPSIYFDPIGEVHANHTRIATQKIYQYRNNPSILATNNLSKVKVLTFAASGGVQNDLSALLGATARSQARTLIGTGATSTATTDVITYNSHGLINGDVVWLEQKIILGGAFSDWKTNTYFVNTIDANTFTLSNTFGGAAITGGVDGVVQPYVTTTYRPFTASAGLASASYVASTGVFTFTNHTTSTNQRTITGVASTSLSSNLINGIGNSTLFGSLVKKNDVLTTLGGTYIGVVSRVINGNQVQLESNAAILTTRSVTGTITVSNGGTTVTGSGTAFTTDIVVNDVLYTAAGIKIGTVSAIGSNTSLTLTAGALLAVTAGIITTSYQLVARTKVCLKGIIGGNILSTRCYVVANSTTNTFKISYDALNTLDITTDGAGIQISKSTPVAIAGEDGVNKCTMDFANINTHHFYGSSGTSMSEVTATNNDAHYNFNIKIHQRALSVPYNLLNRFGETQLGVGTASTSTDFITLTYDARLVDGQRVLYQTTSTAIGGLLSGTPYYVVQADPTNRKFKLSSALNGSPITITNAGSGTLSFYRLFPYYGGSKNPPTWNTESNFSETPGTNADTSLTVNRYLNSLLSPTQKKETLFKWFVPTLFYTNDGTDNVGTSFVYGFDLSNGSGLTGTVTNFSQSPNGKLRITTSNTPVHANGVTSTYSVARGARERIALTTTTNPIPGVQYSGNQVLYSISDVYAVNDIELDVPYVGLNTTISGVTCSLQRYAYGPGPVEWAWLVDLLTSGPVTFGTIDYGVSASPGIMVHVEGSKPIYTTALGELKEW
jgi:hypothetical protein